MLALMAFTFRALIPVGFMPDMQTGHGHLITICSGVQGESQVLMDMDGKPSKEHTKTHEQPCGFSINLSVLTGNGSIAIIAPILISAVIAILPDHFLTHYKTTYHSSRAPPRF